MSVLDTIAEKTRERVIAAKAADPDLPDRVLRSVPHGAEEDEILPFEAALRKSTLSCICEVKRASPSKGLIAPVFPYTEIAVEYERAGADAISCLTEPYWFRGSLGILREIRQAVSLPILRKDFTVDPYMIYEAKEAGADAVLLICSILTEKEIREWLALCRRLRLSAVVEAHDEEEIRMAVRCGARIIGVNNRNLGDFTVDMGNAGRLRACVPEDRVFISESGVKSRRDMEMAERMDADAVLIGETMMRAGDKCQKLRELRGLPFREIPIVKICGLRTEEEIDFANRLRPDLVGFVFAKSRRQVDPEKAKMLRARLDPGISAVGVFVDEDPEKIISLLLDGTIDIAQLHGHETDEMITEIRERTMRPVIRALIPTGEDDDSWKKYPHADLLLLDAGSGSGQKLDWRILKNVGAPFILAGGLTPDNVQEAVRTVRPFGVDVSSGVEYPEGGKSFEKMKSFVESARNAE